MMRFYRSQLLLAALSFAVCGGIAQAESADRDKPIQVEADAGSYNDLKQVGVWTGNVRVTKGTLVVLGERVEVRQDPEGYQYAIVTAGKGQLASFRQRRDPVKPGIEEFIEGVGERIEYDGKAETLRLVSRALMKRLENDKQVDELRGNAITYNSRRAEYSVEGGSSSGSAQSGDGRVRVIIGPRNDSAPNNPLSNSAPRSSDTPALTPAPSAPKK